jgi:hypothetical protein
MIKGFPVSAFNDGDILISPDNIEVQWYLMNGQLEKINNVAAEHEKRTPSPDETFYRMATSMGDALMMKLDQVDAEGKISIEDYKKLHKMIESGDDEARHLVNLHLDNLGK